MPNNLLKHAAPYDYFCLGSHLLGISEIKAGLCIISIDNRG